MAKPIKYNLLLITLALGFIFSFQKAGAFEFTYNEKTFEISDETLESFKGAGGITKQSLLENTGDTQELLSAYLGKLANAENQVLIFRHRPEKIYSSLKTLALEINVAKTEPSLEIKNKIAVNFTPPQSGLTLDLYTSTLNALEALEKSQNSAGLEVEEDKPKKSLMQTNSLGINELVGVGESSFKGSPKNRIHNIKVGVGKMKGVVLAPGEEFSFNKFLGPVEEGYGFLPELVIKKTGTVPELGGGLCQVSSTTFRAAMNTRLPIVERKNHAYAGQYYSPQGTDATIYPGSVDLRFVNDTPAHILIWPYIKDTNKLIFEFYGTKDSRKVTLQKPFSYDRKSDGSMKAEWTRIVEKDGKTATSTFKSVYQSPALFHKEEIFPTTTPQTTVQMPATN